MAERFFNTAGPQKARLNYTIDPLSRVDWQEIQRLIAAERYFLLHAPRQTGKTTTLLAMMEALNGSGSYRALYVNMETSQTARNDADLGDRQFCDSLLQSARVYLPGVLAEEDAREVVAHSQPQQRFRSLLAWWAERSDKPIVLMLDEADALVGDTLISLLRQLRSGYAQRPGSFPQTVILCGVRDIKDYRIHQGDGEIITGGSAFNIKAKSLRMGNFTPEEAVSLYRQHSEETGQVFEEGIFAELWPDTAGQPWLVNALAHEMTWEDRELRDRSRTVTLEHYFAARERLIQSRATHLDQLADKLKEDRVRRVIAPMLTGDEVTQRDADLQYCEDLGLIRRKPSMVISNRIYREVLPP